MVVADLEPPTDRQVEVYFMLHEDRYMSPEARHVVHALVPVPPTASQETWTEAERRAEELVKQVVDGESSLAEAAAPMLEQLPPRFHGQVGDIGFVHRGSLLPEVDEAVFAVPPGSVTEPVKSIYGYHVLQVVGERPPQPLGLDEVREAVAATLASESRRRRLEEFDRELRASAVVKGFECTGPR
jgi:parvulin-like peptidyl-prolyl isomerase